MHEVLYRRVYKSMRGGRGLLAQSLVPELPPIDDFDGRLDLAGLPAADNGAKEIVRTHMHPSLVTQSLPGIILRGS